MCDKRKQTESKNIREEGTKQKRCFQKNLINSKSELTGTKKHVNLSMEAPKDKDYDISLMTGNGGEGRN